MDATMGGAHTAVQEHVGDLTRHEPCGPMDVTRSMQFYMFIENLVLHSLLDSYIIPPNMEVTELATSL